MRVPRTVLAAAAATAFATTLTPAGAAQPTPLAAKRTFAGGSVQRQIVCGTPCLMSFEVRPGERYLHIATTALGGSGAGSPTVAVDVKSASGYVRVCHDTRSGPLDVEGIPFVVVVGVADALDCGAAPSPGGTVLAIFSARNVSFDEALRTFTPDPDRQVAGGVA